MRLVSFSVNNKVDAFTRCSFHAVTSKSFKCSMNSFEKTLANFSSSFDDAMVVGALDGAAESVRNDVRTYPL